MSASYQEDYNLKQAQLAKMAEIAEMPMRLTILDRTKEELIHAQRNVERLERLIDLLERNPEIEQILNLMG